MFPVPCVGRHDPVSGGQKRKSGAGPSDVGYLERCAGMGQAEALPPQWPADLPHPAKKKAATASESEHKTATPSENEHKSATFIENELNQTGNSGRGSNKRPRGKG